MYSFMGYSTVKHEDLQFYDQVDFYTEINVSIAKSIAWCNGLLLGKSRTILWQLTYSIHMG